MSVECIFVLDSGGSKCEALLCERSGAVLGYGSCRCPGVSGRHPASIHQAAVQALTRRNFSELHLAALSRVLPASLCGEIHAERLNVIPCDEVRPALAHAGVSHGIVLLAGTGAFAHGRTADGRIRHLDGTGPILGDFGGGYHIGTLALHAIVRSEWHPRHATSLRPRILQRFAVSSALSLFNLNLFGQDRSLVASIAQTVIEEADRGDAVSGRILHQAAASLAETCADLTDVLGVRDLPCTVVGTGSIIRRSDLYWDELWRCIQASAPRFIPCRLLQPPVVSLAILALRHLDGDAAAAAIDRLLRQWEATDHSRQADVGTGSPTRAATQEKTP